MILGSMAISIPRLAIAVIFTGLPGVITVCIALAVISVVTALRRGGITDVSAHRGRPGPLAPAPRA